MKIDNFTPWINGRCRICKRNDRLEIAAWLNIGTGEVDDDGPISPNHNGTLAGSWCGRCEEHGTFEYAEPEAGDDKPTAQAV